MLEFHEKYHPLTSRPFLTGESYTEHRPCDRLRPFIACFWSSETGIEKKENITVTDSKVLVIPDTCMDILLHINHTRQTVSGYLSSIQDRPFFSIPRAEGDRVSVFAIRFYFWAAHLFLNLNFKEIYNTDLELIHLGREWEKLFEPFYQLATMEEKINRAESFLIRKLNGINWNDNLFNSFHQMLSESGRRTVKEICEYSSISQRQMERQFLQAVGLPMKRVANMVRYQNVWRDMILSPKLDIQDAVYRYGYTDQSHLLREFKRFHGTTPEEAKSIAYKNQVIH